MQWVCVTVLWDSNTNFKITFVVGRWRPNIIGRHPEINVPFNVKIYNGNIRYVTDLYKNGNERLSQEEMEARIGTQITFIAYHALYTSIPKYIRNDLLNQSYNYNLYIPLTTKYYSIHW